MTECPACGGTAWQALPLKLMMCGLRRSPQCGSGRGFVCVKCDFESCGMCVEGAPAAAAAVASAVRAAAAAPAAAAAGHGAAVRKPAIKKKNTTITKKTITKNCPAGKIEHKAPLPLPQPDALLPDSILPVKKRGNVGLGTRVVAGERDAKGHGQPYPERSDATAAVSSSASSPQRESTNILVQIKLHSGETAQVSIAPNATNKALAIATEVELGRQVTKLCFEGGRMLSAPFCSRSTCAAYGVRNGSVVHVAAKPVNCSIAGSTLQ